MSRYEKIKNFDIDNMAWFIQTIIEDTEQQMLDKLATYGLEITFVAPSSDIRHAKIIADLEVEDGDDT